MSLGQLNLPEVILAVGDPWDSMPTALSIFEARLRNLEWVRAITDTEAEVEALEGEDKEKLNRALSALRQDWYNGALNIPDPLRCLARDNPQGLAEAVQSSVLVRDAESWSEAREKVGTAATQSGILMVDLQLSPSNPTQWEIVGELQRKCLGELLQRGHDFGLDVNTAENLKMEALDAKENPCGGVALAIEYRALKKESPRKLIVPISKHQDSVRPLLNVSSLAEGGHSLSVSTRVYRLIITSLACWFELGEPWEQLLWPEEARKEKWYGTGQHDYTELQTPMVDIIKTRIVNYVATCLQSPEDELAPVVADVEKVKGLFNVFKGLVGEAAVACGNHGHNVFLPTIGFLLCVVVAERNPERASELFKAVSWSAFADKSKLREMLPEQDRRLSRQAVGDLIRFLRCVALSENGRDTVNDLEVENDRVKVTLNFQAKLLMERVHARRGGDVNASGTFLELVHSFALESNEEGLAYSPEVAVSLGMQGDAECVVEFKFVERN